MVPRTAPLRLCPWRDCVKCVIAQRHLRFQPDDRRTASAAVCVTSCKQAVFLLCQRVLAPASERVRHRRMGSLSPSVPLPVGAAGQVFGRRVMRPVYACSYGRSSTSGRPPGSFRPADSARPAIVPDEPRTARRSSSSARRRGGHADGRPSAIGGSARGSFAARPCYVTRFAVSAQPDGGDSVPPDTPALRRLRNLRSGPASLIRHAMTHNALSARLSTASCLISPRQRSARCTSGKELQVAA